MFPSLSTRPSRLLVAMVLLSAAVVWFQTPASGLESGSLDPAFGTNGRVMVPGVSAWSGLALALQPDGKIILAGNGMARLESDGSLDTTFGSGGLVTTPFDAVDLALQPDGRILIAGTTDGDFGLARYDAGGSLDSSFSQDGEVETSVGPLNDVLSSVVALSNGKVLAAGKTPIAGVGTAFALVRYNPSGSLDRSFGKAGIVKTFIRTKDQSGGIGGGADAMVALPKGKILLAGRVDGTRRQYVALARYTTSGALDTTFGRLGKVRILAPCQPCAPFVSSLLSVGRGKFVLGGEGVTPNNSHLILARFNADGSLDTTFGYLKGWTFVYDDDYWCNAAGWALAIQPDGKIVQGASFCPYVGVVRYL